MQEVILKANDTELIYELSGEIASENAEEFYEEVMRGYNAEPKDVVFCCSALEFIDSTTLGTFVKIFKTLKGAGHTLRIRELQPRLKKLFEICALDRMMEIES